MSSTEKWKEPTDTFQASYDICLWNMQRQCLGLSRRLQSAEGDLSTANAKSKAVAGLLKAFEHKLATSRNMLVDTDRRLKQALVESEECLPERIVKFCMNL